MNRSKQKKIGFCFLHLFFFFIYFLCILADHSVRPTLELYKKKHLTFYIRQNKPIFDLYNYFLYVCFSTVAIYGISQHAIQRSGKPNAFYLFFLSFIFHPKCLCASILRSCILQFFSITCIETIANQKKNNRFT